MEKLSEIVSGAMTNKGANIKIGKTYYYVAPPTPYILSRVIAPFGKINLSDTDSKIDIISNMEENMQLIDEGIAYAVLGSRKLNFVGRFKLQRIKKKLSQIAIEEKMNILTSIINLVDVKSFFLCARLTKELVSLTTQRRP